MSEQGKQLRGNAAVAGEYTRAAVLAGWEQHGAALSALWGLAPVAQSEQSKQSKQAALESMWAARGVPVVVR